MRFLVADGHHIVCQGLRTILSQIPKYSIVGETNDGAKVVELAMQLNPDVVLLDLALPNRSSTQLLADFADKELHARVIMLSSDDSKSHVIHALGCGAAGYLLKSVTALELHLAVETVIKGYSYLSAELADRVIACYLSANGSSDRPTLSRAVAEVAAVENQTPLTSRQCEILRLMASGYDNHEISQLLEISPRTVETHRAHTMKKLGLTSVYAVVRYALQRGLISLDDAAR